MFHKLYKTKAVVPFLKHQLLFRLIGDRLVSRGHTVTQVRYAGTNMKYDLDTNVTVMTLKIDDSGYPCPRYINRKGEFDIQNREMNLVGKVRY